jgi:hypothetical protein
MKFGTIKRIQKEMPNDKPAPSMEVKKIYFSKNEKYIVMITGNQMIVLEVTDHSFEVKNQIYLPHDKVDESQVEVDSMDTDSDLNQSFNSSDFEKEKDEELKRKMTRVLTYQEKDENNYSKKKILSPEELEAKRRKMELE